jgi:phosphatidylglycerol---prolipoprotein diacylglyceryl transferase
VKGRFNKFLIWLPLIILPFFLIYWLTPYFRGFSEVNPVFLQINDLVIRWYGFFIALAVGIGVWWAETRAHGTKLEKHIFNISLCSIVAGLIGARLMFVALKWSEFSDRWLDVFNLQTGGLSIHGAVILAILAIITYTRYFRLSLWQTLDIFTLPLVLGIAIGRWGNFFNQEAFGPPTDLPWGMYVKEGFRPLGFEDNIFFHPTFLYSSLGLLSLLFLLKYMEKKQSFNGQIFIYFIIGYSLLRFFTEYFRIDSDKLLFFTIAQWVSLSIILIGVIVLILRYRLKKGFN